MAHKTVFCTLFLCLPRQPQRLWFNLSEDTSVVKISRLKSVLWFICVVFRWTFTSGKSFGAEVRILPHHDFSEMVFILFHLFFTCYKLEWQQNSPQKLVGRSWAREVRCHLHPCTPHPLVLEFINRLGACCAALFAVFFFFCSATFRPGIVSALFWVIFKLIKTKDAAIWKLQPISIFDIDIGVMAELMFTDITQTLCSVTIMIKQIQLNQHKQQHVGDQYNINNPMSSQNEKFKDLENLENFWTTSL